MRVVYGLLVVAVLCTGSGCGAKEEAAVMDAQAVLASMQRALGGSDAVACVAVVDALAECEGPSGSFETRVVSARDGRMRFEQTSARGTYVAGIGADGAWSYDTETDQYSPVDSVTATFLRGHELHMLVLAPQTRLRNPELLGEREFDGQAVWVIQFLDELDGKAELYVAVDDGMPLGMKSINHTGQGEREVFIRVDAWRVVDGVRLFERAVFTQGDDDYVYDYVEITLNPNVDPLSAEDARQREAS